MIEVDLVRFKAMLESMLIEKVNAKSVVRAALEDLSYRSTDILDTAASHTSNSLRVQLGQRDYLKLSQIKGALAKMDLGEFGICESCEEEIDLARLEVNPISALCIWCKEEEEKERERYREVNCQGFYYE